MPFLSSDVAARAEGPLMLMHGHGGYPRRMGRAKEANSSTELLRGDFVHLVRPPSPRDGTDEAEPRHDENVITLFTRTWHVSCATDEQGEFSGKE